MTQQDVPEVAGQHPQPNLQPFLDDIHTRLDAPNGFWQQLRHWDPNNPSVQDEPWAPIRFSVGSFDTIHAVLSGDERDVLLGLLCEELGTDLDPKVGDHLDKNGYDRVYSGKRGEKDFFLIESYTYDSTKEAHLDSASIKARPPASLVPPPKPE